MTSLSEALWTNFVRIRTTNEKLRLNTAQRANDRRAAFDLPQPSEPPEPPIAEVENLCLSLDQARQASKTLKLYLSQHGVLSSHCIAPNHARVRQVDHRTQEIVTLEQVFHQISSNGPLSVHWNLTQRMKLSFVLASSLLQFYSTPWMNEPWSKQKICFWRLRPPSSGDRAAFLIDTNHPFIVRRFSETPTACAIQKANARHQLLNLGILLLEIGHEKPFESWISAHGLTMDKVNGNRYDAASAWLHDSAGEFLPFYYDAAARCIECTFHTQSAIPSWDDLDLRKSVCEFVIKPLWRNCYTMDGQ